MSLDVLAVGEVYVDLILSGFDFWPQPGQEAFAREFRREIGGGAAITACGLGMLGARAGIFGVAGADHHEWMASRLRERHVDSAMLAIEPGEPTGFTVAVSTPQDRAFFSYLGANRGFPAMLAQAARERRLDTRHVHLAMAPPWDDAREWFTAIHASGCTLSLDAGWHEDWLKDARALEILRGVDILFVNETEAAAMTGESVRDRMLARFQGAGMACVGLKLGEEGAALLRNGEVSYGKPPSVKPVDTTGAGDCFDAGFLYGWLNAEPSETCLRIANACGALSTEALGGIGGFPTRERLAAALEEFHA